MGEREVAYQAYLQSVAWLAFRRQIYRERGLRCHACGSIERPDVHHATYERFGGREESQDVVVLCRTCHLAVHNAHKRSRRPLEATTWAFVRRAHRRQRRARAQGSRRPKRSRESAARRALDRNARRLGVAV